MSLAYQTAVEKQGLSRAIWRYKWRAAVFFAAAMLLAVSYAVLAPRTYRSEGRLIVRMGAGQTARSAGTVNADSPSYSMPQSWESRVNTVVELLKSRPLLEHVVDAVGPSAIIQPPPNVNCPETLSSHPFQRSLWATRERITETVFRLEQYLARLGSDVSPSPDRREEAMAAVARRLHVEPLRGSSVVAISFTSRSPQIAHAVVSELIERYSEEHLRLNTADGAEQFFRSEKSKRLEALAAKQHQLLELRNQAGPVSADGQRPIIVQQIARLEHEVSVAEAETSASSAKLHRLRSELAQAVEPVSQEDASKGDAPNYDDIQSELDSVRKQQREAAAKYTEGHPKMQQLRQTEADLKGLLAGRPVDPRAVGGQVVGDVSSIHREIAAEELRSASLEAKRQSLNGQLQAARLEWNELNRNDVAVASLLRDIDALEANYQRYVAGIEQTRIDRALAQERISDVAVLEPASLEPRPSFPQASLCLIVGAVCGLLGASTLALRAQRRERAFALPDGIDLEPQVPVLASIPRLKRRQMALAERN